MNKKSKSSRRMDGCNRVLKLFGFGSFFRLGTYPRDIDLLIIHENVSPESIQFAIRCKALIKAVIPSAHIVMLSEQEERDLGFLGKSNAVLLGIISDAVGRVEIQGLASRITGP
jgi:hypothetical protein